MISENQYNLVFMALIVLGAGALFLLLATVSESKTVRDIVEFKKRRLNPPEEEEEQ